jgi:hypothetical protein
MQKTKKSKQKKEKTDRYDYLLQQKIRDQIREITVWLVSMVTCLHVFISLVGQLVQVFIMPFMLVCLIVTSRFLLQTCVCCEFATTG